MAFSPAVEQWRSLLARYFAPEDVEKALYVIAGESGGNAAIRNPTSGATGLFQLLPSAGLGGDVPIEQLQDPETNVRIAAQAVYGGSGWAPWGENNSFNGQPFGALGMNPYPGTQALNGGHPLDGGQVMANQQVQIGGVWYSIQPEGVYQWNAQTNGWAALDPGSAVQIQQLAAAQIAGANVGGGGGSGGAGGINDEIARILAGGGSNPSLNFGTVMIGGVLHNVARNSQTGAIVQDYGPSAQTSAQTSQQQPNGIIHTDPSTGHQILINPQTGATIRDLGGAPASTEPKVQWIDGVPYSWTPQGGWAIEAGLPTQPRENSAPSVVNNNGNPMIWNPQTNSFVPAPGLSSSAAPGSVTAQDQFNSEQQQARDAANRAAEAARQQASDAAALQRQQMSDQAANLRQQSQLAFQAGDNAKGRQLQAASDLLQRQFQAEEQKAARLQRAAEFKATYGIQKAQFAQDQRKQKLAEADSFATHVHDVSPIDFEAWTAAMGGGNLANAMHRGGNALSDAALSPAALVLDQLRQPMETLPDFSYTDPGNPFANQQIDPSLYQPTPVPSFSGAPMVGGGAGAPLLPAQSSFPVQGAPPPAQNVQRTAAPPPQAPPASVFRPPQVGGTTGQQYVQTGYLPPRNQQGTPISRGPAPIPIQPALPSNAVSYNNQLGEGTTWSIPRHATGGMTTGAETNRILVGDAQGADPFAGNARPEAVDISVRGEPDVLNIHSAPETAVLLGREMMRGHRFGMPPRYWGEMPHEFNGVQRFATGGVLSGPETAGVAAAQLWQLGSPAGAPWSAAWRPINSNEPGAFSQYQLNSIVPTQYGGTGQLPAYASSLGGGTTATPPPSQVITQPGQTPVAVAPVVTQQPGQTPVATPPAEAKPPLYNPQPVDSSKSAQESSAVRDWQGAAQPAQQAQEAAPIMQAPAVGAQQMGSQGLRMPATFGTVPVAKPAAPGNGIYRFADGGLYVPAPASTALLDEIRAFRERTPLLRGFNPYASDFWQSTLPSRRDVGFAAIQDRWGAPVADQQAESLAKRVRGFGRSGLAVGA